ncbi:hypothetical protein JQU17_12275, partial [Ponticoccus sp. SC2-23]|nr:hypothetical protein [Ponticoccus sp. SC6-9]MBM1226712.1 hypothetical protein [Ponticoccus sp. SC6-15]MBM1230663.1 hypothetical protein [Ponticoccus sp. SC6-38]MBM1235186.1 hypothetical protein [Ponticoccus sp. SC6-45]MBM1243466.1 hypothetical protein [Ponticoccus sp. SC2-64]MBM1248710.1 hypothetical protein [Ponticoccus sp. SC6-42]MBM1253295.1 hypothetical protein [Ponticoccus sp. SC6-33]MBM1257693.1 hypothetical protein [Ponticoccus sp. SC6-60]MBM1262189.1 hypothetical protein [Pontico
PGLGVSDAPVDAKIAAAGPVECGIRPEHFTKMEPGDLLTVEHVEELGGVAYVYARAKTGERVIIEHRGNEPIDHSGSIAVDFERASLRLFDTATGRRIV